MYYIILIQTFPRGYRDFNDKRIYFQPSLKESDYFDLKRYINS